jgi:signal transduction histidine kinase
VESAALLSDTLDGTALVERIFVRNAGGPTLDHLRAQRLEQVGALTISMTPAIEALAAALQQRARGSAAGTPDTQAEAVAGLTDQVHALVRQLGAFGRRQTATIEILNLDETIRQAQPMLARLIGEFVDLDLRLASDALVLASRPDLEQLIVSLASVARDSLPVGGRIVIETGDHPPASAPGAVPAAAGDAAMWMEISGYGVQSPADVPALLQAARRCQASVQTHAAPGGGMRIDVIFAKSEG